jgi:hypothetical protein
VNLVSELHREDAYTSRPGREEVRRRTLPGWNHGDLVLAIIAFCFLAVSVPVVIRGAPLADDFNNCLAPQELGLGGFAAESWDRLGAIRLARFPEIALTTGVCRSLPFAVAIVVPLLLTLGTAWLVRGLLRDLLVPDPWPGIAGAAWLLQPLGTESALWPAALHVPLGLALGIGALRMHRANRHAWACVCVAGAVASVEQLILVMPVAAGLVTPEPGRRRAVISTTAVVVIALIAFAAWPGDDPRLNPTLSDRISGAFEDPFFYMRFAAVGLGMHSIPLALKWSLPLGVLVLLIGGLAGWRLLGARIQKRREHAGLPTRAVIWLALLVLLANVPVALNVLHQGSPRIFAPTWLIIAVGLGVLGPHLIHKRRAVAGAAFGVFAAGALLSLAFSGWVRTQNADATENAANAIAQRTPDGTHVAVCDVRRSVVDDAPRGAFATTEFIYDWAASDVVAYYTDLRVTVSIAGELWDRPCPSEAVVDAVFSFPELTRDTE